MGGRTGLRMCGRKRFARACAWRIRDAIRRQRSRLWPPCSRLIWWTPRESLSTQRAAWWATGTNLAFVSYAADPQRGLVIALGAIDNLGKGAAGQALQNANLMCGLPQQAGLEGAPLWP